MLSPNNMSLLIYNSIWTGTQIDNSIKKVLDSQVTANELALLHSTTLGVAVSSKALITDTNKNLSGLNLLSVSTLKAGLTLYTNKTTDPTDDPVDGLYVYNKDGALYTKDSTGEVKLLGAGNEQVFTFTATTSVTCLHELKNRYPLVTIVGLDNKPLGGDIVYDSIDNLYVSFEHVQSGKVIVRTVR